MSTLALAPPSGTRFPSRRPPLWWVLLRHEWRLTVRDFRSFPGGRGARAGREKRLGRARFIFNIVAAAVFLHTIGLFTLDAQGRFLSANPALQGMLGRNVLAIGSNSWQQHFDQGAWTQLHHFVYNQVDGELEIKGKKPLDASEPRRFLVKATLANDKIEGSLQDVTEKSRAAEDLNFPGLQRPVDQGPEPTRHRKRL